VKEYVLIGALTMGLISVDACTARDVAKDAYTVQTKACLVAYDDAPHQRACVEYVRNRWTEAGAPPATVGDAGHE
jgi:hypothetical protein